MTPWILLLAGAALAAPPVHHVLSVHLDPADHRLSVDDAFTVGGAVPQDPGGGYRFVLHAGLEPRIRSRGWRLEPGSAEAPDRATAAEEGESVPVRTWRLVPGRRAEAIVRLSMSGEIHHPVVTAETDYARGFAETPGLVDAAGVFLTGASRWVPTFGMERVTYDLAVHLPQGWDAVSQGHRSRTTGRRGSVVVRWTGAGPAEEVVLAAGPWTGTWTVAGDTEIGTLLVQDDPALAWRYLDATRRTLAMYEAILPPYPFPVFVTAENFWETGYGFPGFTLLGPKVLRFPWVLASSFPHEILHSWWGNGVLVAAEGGNWCEGLTAYMADHLLAEQRQEGALHRRNTLQRYADFVAREGRDFPLSEFTGRTSAASEAVGYGKALLLFHMARRSMGDEAFLAALNRFFETHRFRRASFADLAAAFDATDPGWRAFFETWTRRTGAPRLALGEVGIRPPERRADAAAWRLEVEVRQVQHEDPFPLTVPVAVTLEGSPVALEVPCTFEGRTCRVTVPCPNRPLRVDVDPAFDVVRLLDPFEVPPALSTVQGDTEAVFVLPSGVSEAEDRAWRDLATAWSRPGTPRFLSDATLDGLPAAGWLLGAHNRLGPGLAATLASEGVQADAVRLAVGAESFPRADHAWVLVTRSPKDPARALAWVSADDPAAIRGLAAKLPHYGRYSWLAFRGDAPDNVGKGTWPPTGSELSRILDGPSTTAAPLPARKALAEPAPRFDADRIAETVNWLADPAREGRKPGSKGMEAATAWVETRLAATGLEPAGDDGHRQAWTGEGDVPLVNLVGRLPGTDPTLPPVLVLAHLDHLGFGPLEPDGPPVLFPGADDNASGVAGLLEIAAALAAEPPRARSVLFAITTAEESGSVGARHLVDALGATRPMACVNLDMIGRPERLLVLDVASAREWRYALMGATYTTGVPSVPAPVPLAAGDHAACLDVGIPGIQFTTGPHADYHRPGDTADKVDATHMAQILAVPLEVIRWLAQRLDPLESTNTSTDAPARPPSSGAGVGLGTLPDFAFAGPGVRVQEVRPGSSGEAAGIRAGDIILAVNGAPVADLRALAEAWRAGRAGDRVTVRIDRSGQTLDLEAVLEPRALGGPR